MRTPAIAEIIDLLSQKWMMRIIWELRNDPMTFRELQKACGKLSPTVLNIRLKVLREAEIAQKHKDHGYTLTHMGQELLEVYKPLNEWAIDWQIKRKKTKT
ncbi:MAG: helix-turn-helix domain-containing protein [Halioglobus sp.]